MKTLNFIEYQNLETNPSAIHGDHEFAKSICLCLLKYVQNVTVKLNSSVLVEMYLKRCFSVSFLEEAHHDIETSLET